MQVKLLRALQERAVRLVGSETEVPVNVRVISATHKDLGKLLSQGSFRQDLYYRLNVIEIRTPPLREHAEDIPLLAEAILARLAQSNDLGGPPKLEAEALRRLQAYPFPGNVRELENVLERAVTLSDGKRIAAAELQLRGDTAGLVPAAATGNVAEPGATAPAGPQAAGAGLEDQMEEMERRAIREALERSRYNKTKAAVLLGMSFRSLRYRIKKLGIE
jgi:two-component system response regulator PilR (NtrC family)